MSIKTVTLYCLFLFPNILIARPSQKVFTIMLEPAGDAKHTGRAIDDCFERGITLQFAERLKKTIEVELPHVRVILSRFAGESLEPLQNANFSNRLAVDLYLSIHLFEEQDEKPILYLYRYIANRITDYWQHKDALQFIPYDQAHRTNVNHTKEYANRMYNALLTFDKKFETKEPIGFPFKPLIGIQAPAIAFEASLKNKDDWQLYLNPIVQSVKTVLEYDIN